MRHKVTGLVFDPHQRGALAAATERLTEPRTVQELGRRGSELVEEQTPQTAATALRDNLEPVANEMTEQPQLIVIGLDRAAPELVFDAWRHDLPTLDALMSKGIHGRLEELHPGITVPAWSTMMTGLDPGQLGFYGFRNRSDYSYGGLRIANGSAVKHPRVWSVLSRLGKRVGVVSVPQTYPVEAVNGELVSCFLTPSDAVDYTYPADLRDRTEAGSGGPAA